MNICFNIPKWDKIRKPIVERDNHCCRMCGKDYKLHVHHIDYNRKNNTSENLITLCSYCHNAIHAEGYKPCDHEGHPTPWDKTSTRDEFNQEYSW